MTIDVEALKNATDIVSVVGAYVSLKKRGAEYLGSCPFHNDATPSFYVIPAKRFCNCFGCGWSGDVIDFLREKEGVDFKTAAEMLGANVEWKPKPIEQSAKPLPDRVTSKPPANAGKPAMTIRGLGEPSRTWEYRDADGGILGYVARYETPEGKQIRCWTWGKRGDQDPGWACGHWNKPRPLYGLERLAARPDDPVMVVEGEKAADAAAELVGTHYVVVTWPGGANGWKHAEFGPLAGRKVTLWPDADQPGVDCMTDLAAVLADPKGLGCSVKLINPLAPGDNPTDEIPEGWDAANALAEGWTQAMVYAWAKPRATPYEIPQPKEPNPAPQGGPEASPSLPPASAPPAAAGPPNAATQTSTAILTSASSHEDVGQGGFADAAPIPEQTAQIIALQPPPDDAPPLEAYASDPAAASRRPRKKPRLASVNGNLAESTDPERDPLPAELSDDALADHLAATYGADWRYVKPWGAWFRWDGDGWRKDEQAAIDRLCLQITRQAIYWAEGLRLTPDGRRKINSRRTAGAIRDNASNDPRCAAAMDQWDSDPWLLGCPGGVLDLRAGKMLEAEREQYITKRCAVAPAAGKPERWLAFLNQITAGDESLIGYLQRFAGYALTGETSEHSLVFLYGTGANGKTVFLQTLSGILGDYAVSAGIETFTETKNERHSTEIARLRGARLVVTEETDSGGKWAEGKIKRLTGGGKISAHFMRQDDFEFTPQFKLMIAGNHKPMLRAVDEAIRRRFHLIPFKVTIPVAERDKHLFEKLREEWPQILQWMMEGCVEWQLASLGMPEAIQDATDQYLQAEDVLGQWIDDCCERESRTESATAYRNYCEWCDKQGERPWSRRTWANALVDRGFTTSRTASARMIEGLSLKLRDVAPPPFEDGYRVP